MFLFCCSSSSRFCHRVKISQLRLTCMTVMALCDIIKGCILHMWAFFFLTCFKKWGARRRSKEWTSSVNFYFLNIDKSEFSIKFLNHSHETGTACLSFYVRSFLQPCSLQGRCKRSALLPFIPADVVYVSIAARKKKGSPALFYPQESRLFCF